MTILVFSLVLLAAALHAIWNAVIKGTGDKTIAIGLVALGHMVLGLIGAFFFATSRYQGHSIYNCLHHNTLGLLLWLNNSL